VLVWYRDETLRRQLDRIGVRPEDVTWVAVSHTHGDHVGNVESFPKSKFLVQRPEYELARSSTPDPFAEVRNFELLSGDHDVFGDGSVMLISTPGHTPGHQSLLAKLPNTGALLLTGDLVHFRYMWDHKVVPSFNFDRARSLASIDRVERLVAEHGAQLWIGHDKDIAATIRRAPAFYE
jgi:N-acyl homoserine lactone hydrolase